MPDLDDFRAFYALADRLIDGASKENVAEAARLVVLNVAHYQQKYGALTDRSASMGSGVTRVLFFA